MPNRIPHFQMSNFLRHNTTPIPLSSIRLTGSTDSHCPICKNPYSDPPSDSVHPEIGADVPEYAVKVCHRPCSHVFGRHCLEQHIRAGMPWSHTCPLCRAVWFNAPNVGRQQVLREIEDGLMRLARVEIQEPDVRMELDDVEQALERIRDVLYEQRWI